MATAIAFDIGDKFCKIGVGKGGTLKVMQNQVGKRKTVSVVGFTPENRLFDQEATAQQTSNSKNTVVGFKALLGKTTSDPSLDMEKDYVSQPIVESKSKGCGVKLKYLNKETILTPTQVTASLLSHLKETAVKGLGSALPDAVLGCPPWWTEIERYALLDAARIAGINVSRIMNETTAVALDYGINLSLEKNSKKVCLFIDVGHSNVNVSAVEFWRGENKTSQGLKVLATASERGTGGRSFNTILEKYFADMILKKYKLDVMSRPKPKLKLMRTCEKIKTRLTANNRAPFSVEYMMDDTDVSGSIERKEFEELAKPILEKIVQPIDKVLKSTGLKTTDFYTIEIVGGGSRIPCVKSAIKKFVGRELSYHCDADESCAKGLVLQAAMLSPLFRTRGYQVEDISPYPIGVSWGPVGGVPEEKDFSPLFYLNGSLPTIKAMSFQDRKESFQLTATYSNPDTMPKTPVIIGKYVIKGFPKKFVGEKVKVKVWIQMNINGNVEVTKASCIQTLPEEVEKPAPAKEVKKDDKKEEAKKEESKTEEAPKGGTKDAPKEPAKEAPKEVKPEKKKRKVEKSALIVETQNDLKLSNAEFKKLQQLEVTMIHTDVLVAETAAIRNDLEQYTLEMSASVQDELAMFVDKAISEDFVKQLKDAEEWVVYDEGSYAQKSTVKKRLTDLKKIGDPIVARKAEYLNGPQLVEQLKLTIGKYRQLASAGDPKYSHIDKSLLESIINTCADLDKWATDAAVALGGADKTKDSPVKCDTIRAKKREIIDFATPILSTPKPKPKPEPKKEEKKAGKSFV